jgi:hypothetical protein
MTSAFLPLVVAAVLPFAICFGVARAGRARTAWWLPGGILAITLTFVVLGLRLGSEVSTAFDAVRNILALGLPAALGGVLGILLGRRRA